MGADDPSLNEWVWEIRKTESGRSLRRLIEDARYKGYEPRDVSKGDDL